MGLMQEVRRGPVALDTAIFIYFIEEHPKFLPALLPLFKQIDSGRLPEVTSSLTLLETLVVPYRAGNAALAERYEALLTRSRIQLVDPDRGQMRAAAQIRAVSRIRSPDALQLAAALSAGCSSLLTSDRDLPAIPGLRILQLGDHIE